jgi:predicted enzyme related to lactoylglutathione lyase
MQAHYLEVVTADVESVCGTYSSVHGIRFGPAVPQLGNARTAALAGGALLGVRAPLRETETPVVRPYWRVPDIEQSVAAAVQAEAVIAVPVMAIPGYGKFAIYLQGGNEHGLWQV